MFRSSYESAPEQLQKCSGAVTKVFRSRFKSSGTVISLPEQLKVFRITYKCSGAVTKVLRSSYESVPEQLQKCSGSVLSLPEQL